MKVSRRFFSDLVHRIRYSFSVLLIGGSLLASANTQAQTIVNVETALGNFSIELFDTAAPATVANFLNYVTSGRYNGSIIHRSVPGFVIQGGGFTFDSTTQTFPNVAVDAPVVNEFSIPNTRGTLAMAKLGGDPNSATSQWFVNLADNRANLDNQNGGFTVFGRVVEPGMTVVDAISNLGRFNLGGALDTIPLITVANGDSVVRNVVSLQMSVSQPPAPVISNTFDAATNLLNLKVSLDGNEFVGVSFAVESMSPQAVIRALPESVTPLSAGDVSFATFTAADGSLVIPQLYIGGELAFRNARFTLTDGAQSLFTLQSVEQ